MKKRKFHVIGNSFRFTTHGNQGYSTHGKIPELVDWVDSASEPSEGRFFINEAIVNGLYDSRPGLQYGWLLESTPLIEPTVNHVLDNIHFYKQRFDAVFTHDTRVLRHGSKFKWVPGMCHWIKKPGLYRKSRLVSMISSTKDWLPGHKKRLAWVQRLQHQVDLFGVGHRYILDIEDGLCSYMFSVAIENAELPGYFTEKILNCFATGTVPLYIGAPNISDYFNPNGILPVTEKLSLSRDLYESMKPAIVDNYHRVLEYDNCEDFVAKNYL